METTFKTGDLILTYLYLHSGVFGGEAIGMVYKVEKGALLGGGDRLHIYLTTCKMVIRADWECSFLGATTVSIVNQN